MNRSQNNNATALTVVEGTIALDRTPQTADDTESVAPTYEAEDDDFADGPADVAANGDDPAVVALKYEVAGADASAFVSPLAVTDGVAALVFKSDHKVNFEAKAEYEITIVASDEFCSRGNRHGGRDDYVVNAEDVGVVTPTQREPQVGKEVVAALGDQDGNIRGQKWQWYRNVAAGTAAEVETALSGLNATVGNAATGLCTPTTAAAGDACRIGGATSPTTRRLGLICGLL